METMEGNTQLATSDGRRLALQAVHIGGAVEGLLLTTAMRQTYANTTKDTIEVTYTFPVAWGTTLLGLDAVIGGRRMQGVVVAKQEAETRYEKAINEGDTPVMVQESAAGVMTANLGNIKPGEKVELTLRCAQPLRIEQGEVRICLPTVLAPRYGDAHGPGALAPHESDAVDHGAVYPLSILLKLTGAIARGEIQCATHKARIAAAEDGMTVRMEGGFLDRDFVVTAGNIPSASFAVSCRDGEEHMVMASFCPQLAQAKAPLFLKVLVDCSGSMTGDSINEARKALHGVLQELSPGDHVSFSRFGSEVRHQQEYMIPFSDAVRRGLAKAIDMTDADMGGTRMEEAIRSTIEDIDVPREINQQPCLLLITDDLVWGANTMLERAAGKGHRIFAVGVGSAPAEATLRLLAELTGGACAFVTPNEDIVQSIVGMFRRMRGARPSTMRVEWGATPTWQTPLPASVFDGDTVHAFATFPGELPEPPRLVWEEDGRPHAVSPDVVVSSDNPEIARLGGWQKVLTAGNPDLARQLALDYQLVTKWTSLFLVHDRGEDKAKGLPTLVQVPQMLAAGTHGMGSVVARAAQLGVCPNRSFSNDSRRLRIPGNAVRKAYRPGMEDILAYESIDRCMDVLSSPSECILAERAIDAVEPQASLTEMLAAFLRQAPHETDLADVVPAVAMHAPAGVEQRITDMAGQANLPAVVLWAVFLEWLMDALGGAAEGKRHAARLLRAARKGIAADRIYAVRQDVSQAFGGMIPESVAA